MDENVILSYDGELTQDIISENTDIIENGIENMGIMGKVATIAIELSQNMMTYSKSLDKDCNQIVPAGFIEVIKYNDIYKVSSKNIISINDKSRVEPKLLEIQSLDASGIKKRYKELRRSGENSHDNNGGIGFFEIAKQTTSIDFEFIVINDGKFYFIINAIVEPKKR